MTVSALPEGFDNRQKGDWKNVWPLKYIKPSWTAFGPRAKEWWAHWREFPIILFAIRGPGFWRYENTDGTAEFKGEGAESRRDIVYQDLTFIDTLGGKAQVYLSVIQYWCAWHFAILWPLHIQWHKYKGDYPKPFDRPTKEQEQRFIRAGGRRNADGFYDFPSAHQGEFN